MDRPIKSVLVVVLLLGAMALGSHQAAAQNYPDSDAVLCACTVNELIYENDGTITEVHTLDRFTYFTPPHGECMEHGSLPELLGDPDVQDEYRVKYTHCEALVSKSVCTGACDQDVTVCLAFCPNPLKIICCH